MTTFNYTTGSTANLVASGTASMTDINGPFADIKTFLNGTNIDATNITSVADSNLESPQNGSWMPLLHAPFGGGVTGLPHFSTTVSFIGGGLSGQQWSPVPAGSDETAPVGMWAPPSTAGDLTVTGKTATVRLRLTWASNNTALGTNITFGLYPITATAGGAGLISMTAGAALLSTTITSPAANSSGVATSGTLAVSSVTGGIVYRVGAVTSGAPAGASTFTAACTLELAHV